MPGPIPEPLRPPTARVGQILVGDDAEGVVLLRWRRDGVHAERSADGVRWREMPLGDAAERLREMVPLCAGVAERGSLFCADTADAVREVEIGTAEPATPTGFRPSADPGEWYESAEGLPEMAIVRDAQSGAYRAFFCARRRTGRHPERRGCIGVARSSDLAAWRAEPPVLAPNAYPRLFAPHVITEGGRTLLFYATAEEGGIRALRFATAASPDGPYEILDPDVLACDMRQALHTARAGGRRLVFFTRPAADATGTQEVSRPAMLEFHADGRPWFRYYDALTRLSSKTVFQTEASLASREILVRVLPRYGANVRLTARVANRGARAVGVLLRTSITGHDNVTLWLEYEAGAVSLRRGVNGRLLGRARRALEAQGEHRVTVWAEGAYADVYIDDEWVLTGQTETRRSGGFGVAVRGGEANVTEMTAQVIEASAG